ncbi:MAG: ATP-binding cassette domain-containing protein [Clostridia bacterium]|nr:ATP-binding cassette domain-containing protein [Clostridia bacterium]
MKLEDVKKAYNVPVIKGFSYDFPKSGLFLIRGRSGVGKTTLLRIMAGIEKADSGKVSLKGEVISMVFQEDRLLPFLTLKENVLITKKHRDESKAQALLERFGLKDAADLYPAELSGGMRLRGAIVRSLYYGGDIYLWDEPTKELDPENRALVIEAIRERAKDALVITVTHDPELTGGTEIELE